MPSLIRLQRYLCFRIGAHKLAEKSIRQARQLMLSQDPADIHAALRLLDSTLKALPQCEKAIELKARALLCLRRFRDIIILLQESVPSLKSDSLSAKVSSEETVKLLPANSNGRRIRRIPAFQCLLSMYPQRPLQTRYNTKAERDLWKYVVLGQACCHLGMMEDAMILLLNGKKEALAARRKQSTRLEDDSFLLDNVHTASDSEVVSHLLSNIKLLLRRRTAALAALDAGLYTEAARHFSKILDGKRGTPQGFVAECYMLRAVAHQAANKVVDALADCNRCLCLNPTCAEALSTRASLYEMIGCFSDSLEDLGNLKSLYEMVLASNGQLVHIQHSTASDLQGCIEFINDRIASVVERMNGQCMLDHHRVLGLSRSCSRAEVERAYLLLSMKHRPEKSAHFIDRCEFVDERDMEAVKAEARAQGLKLFKMFQKAYTYIVTVMLDEEMKGMRHLPEGIGMNMESSKDGPMSWYGMQMSQADEVKTQSFCIVSTKIEQQVQSQQLPTTFLEVGHQIQTQHVFSGKAEHQVQQYPHSVCADGGHQQYTTNVQCVVSDDHWLNCKENCPAEILGPGGFSSCSYVDDQQDADRLSDLETYGDAGQLMDTSPLAQISTCREVVNMSTLHSQGLPSEAWIGLSDWGHSIHALSVT
ncbi:hypothetical protein KP509_10G002100 [Ceratopteris richardii]|uniref:Uncharacterized protein n=1 Tax=Ceratopteris richardii TaxID=49495 RepID=A0A8T2TXY2_CERRI|nr:hypothetical protein KP509_10G002100 [Ceratopteris richardii]KAH7426442.1 hypothetical protein KP509_10G002100 [Ceratopteris richardii]KAH7426443.1 hypothetical protein KP509_10G002100 [Ceratopteris richardii]